jgi:cobalt-zinc-cadmium efflux system protein
MKNGNVPGRHRDTSYNRSFAVAVFLNGAFLAIEAVYGLLAGSLALVADAGHNFSDVLGLLLAWGASIAARRPPTARHTYGFRRATILAALSSAILLLMALGIIGWEAVGRFVRGTTVDYGVMAIVAAIGVVVNAATALLFVSGRKRDLNIRGAFLHMAADAGVSLAVVAAALLIGAAGWLWLDPALSLGIVAVILVGTWGLLRESANLAMDAVPAGIDPGAVRGFLANLPRVTEVHDLHIWGMSTTETALTAHLVMPPPPPDDCFYQNAAESLRERFGIGHATLQIESGKTPCEHASPERV